MPRLLDYYKLTKPGIIRGNLLSFAAGFLLASSKNVDLALFLASALGLALIIASASIFNNYIDRNIDKLMERTKNRALALGMIDHKAALSFAVLFLLAGSGLLAAYVNLLSLGAALFGFILYVAVYGYYKRRSHIGTIVGSFSGAAPPVVGYCAASGSFTLAAFFLFLILVFWQMPHFYAIAIYRLNDYKAAKIPVLPIARSIRAAKHHMLGYVFALIATSLAMSFFGYSGLTYGVVATLLGLVWLFKVAGGLTQEVNNTVWAKSVFRFSLMVLSGLCVTLALNNWLP